MTDHCSWFPEFIGDHYIGACCAAHDATSGGWLDFASHAVLARCVSQTGAGPAWGSLMFAGIALGGGVYAAWTALERWQARRR